MPDPTTPARHRAILCHYDSYSAALLFVRWPDGSLLWPGPLAADVAGPDDAALHPALCAHLGLPDEALLRDPDYDETVVVDGVPVHVQLLCSTAPDAPHEVAQAAGAAFRHLPALRGAAPEELALLRVVFNLKVGGAGARRAAARA